jgi:hypothetical protein
LEYIWVRGFVDLAEWRGDKKSTYIFLFVFVIWRRDEFIEPTAAADITQVAAQSPGLWTCVFARAFRIGDAGLQRQQLCLDISMTTRNA